MKSMARASWAFVVLLASVLTVVPAAPAAAGPPPIGVITTVGGGGTGDGNPALGTRLVAPIDVDVDSVGNIYIADAARVRRVDASTGIVTTVAGTGEPGFAGDGGPATSALLGRYLHIALHPGGDLYIADSSNCRIRKVDSGGTITTVAGTGAECCVAGEDVDAGERVEDADAGLVEAVGDDVGEEGDIKDDDEGGDDGDEDREGDRGDDDEQEERE